MLLSLLTTYMPAFAMLAVMYFSGNQFYNMTHPLRNVDVSQYKERQLIGCNWKSKQAYDLYVLLSTSASHRGVDIYSHSIASAGSSSSGTYLLVSKKGLIFNESSPEMDFSVNISRVGEGGDVVRVKGRDKIWTVVNKNRSNDDLYIKTFICKANAVNVNSTTTSLVSGAKCLFDSVKLLKYDVIPKSFQNRYLLRDIPILASYFPATDEELSLIRMAPTTVIRYWKPEVAVRLVTDNSAYPQDYLPEVMAPLLIRSSGGGYSYRPPLFVDEVGLTSDKYLPLNESVSSLPLKVSYSSISLQRWLFMEHMHQALSDQKGLGFSDKDIDDVRRLISGTSVYYLTITFVASFLHLIFEFLSFKSDIQFWKNMNSLVGLSFKQLLIDLVSQIVICFYLFENDSSMLVLIPSAVGVLIQLWKISKVYRKKLLHISATEIEGSAVVDSNNDRLNKLTQQADTLALSYLMMLFVPALIGFAAKSLIYDKHKSWYSFCVNTTTGLVYSSGFAFMLPQLYINYRLKSVSHLPWAFLFYKFINTFIDDLFAFIIKMPTMHRLSCFRDDVVFLIYLYQRHVYSVDESRPREK